MKLNELRAVGQHMGLFNWALIKLAGAFGLLPHQRVRRYKVTLFGETLGTFTLPIGDHMENPSASLRPVLTRPFRIEFGEDTFYYWVEADPNGGFKMVEFHPPSLELRDEAARFFTVANGLNADGSFNPSRALPVPVQTKDEARLIRAILANRDADQPYLDYAAWLSAKGNTYGDYIRSTLEIEKLPEGDKKRERMEGQREKLIARDGPRWVLPINNVGIYTGVYVSGLDAYYPTLFHGKKGVIEELDVRHDALVFPANVGVLFAGAPFLRKLSINHSKLTVGEFAAFPQFAQLESLSLSVATGIANDVRVFAESPHFGALRELGLSGNYIGSEGAEHLASAAWLVGLRSLDLGMNSLGDDGVRALAESPNVANLTTLDLRYNNLTDQGLIALCESPNFAWLTVLNLESNAFTAEGIRALVAAPFAPTLTSLNLSTNGLDGVALAMLATGAFPALKTLNIAHNSATDEGVGAVVASPFFRTLEVFNANGTVADTATANALAAHGFLSLRELELAYNAMSDAAMKTLARSKALAKLTKLSVNDNPFGPAGTEALASADMSQLENFDISRVACGPAGARALAASRYFKSLKKFYISEDRVGTARTELVERFTDDVMVFTS